MSSKPDIASSPPFDASKNTLHQSYFELHVIQSPRHDIILTLLSTTSSESETVESIRFT